MNPFDVLTAPPALVKRAFDDLHDIAQLARRFTATEDRILARIEPLESDLQRIRTGVELLAAELSGVLAAVAPLGRLEQEIVVTRRAAEMLPPMLDELETLLGGVRAAVDPLRGQLDDLAEEMAPMEHLAPIRRGIEPLEQSMVAVRESVDELEPMIADLDRKIQLIEPRLEDMQESIEPIGDLAERVPGGRKRRSGG